MFLFKKKILNAEDTELVKKLLSMIETQSRQITVLASKQQWWQSDENKSIRFATVLENHRYVFALRRLKCFGGTKYRLHRNHKNIDCDTTLLKKMFVELSKIGAKSKE